MGLRDSVAPISSWFLGRFAVDLSKVSLGRLLRKTRTNRFSTELLYEFNQEIGTGLGNRVADDIGPAGAPRGIADEISKHIYDDADLTISLPRSTTLVCRHRGHGIHASETRLCGRFIPAPATRLRGTRTPLLSPTTQKRFIPARASRVGGPRSTAMLRHLWPVLPQLQIWYNDDRLIRLRAEGSREHSQQQRPFHDPDGTLKDWKQKGANDHRDDRSACTNHAEAHPSGLRELYRARSRKAHEWGKVIRF